MARDDYLGELEQLALAAVVRLRGTGYGVTIRREIAERAERDVSYGAIYATVERLEQKGFVKSEIGESTPERGGRAKRHYTVTAPGIAALEWSWQMMTRMRKGLRKATTGVDPVLSSEG